MEAAADDDAAAAGRAVFGEDEMGGCVRGGGRFGVLREREQYHVYKLCWCRPAAKYVYIYHR